MAVFFSCQERNVPLETHAVLSHNQRFNFKPLIRVICTKPSGNVFQLDKILFHVSELGWGCAASTIRSVTFPWQPAPPSPLPVPSPALPPSTLPLQDSAVHLPRGVEQTQGDFFFLPCRKNMFFFLALNEVSGPALQSHCGARTSLNVF